VSETPRGIDEGGDLAVAAISLSNIPYKQIFCVDFEFQAPAGERPRPLCMVARELRTGREWRLWRNELTALKRAPFDTGPDALFIAYSAGAELGCFLELGWPLPERVVDLLAENRVQINGLRLPQGLGDGLLGALAMRPRSHRR